jgi:predicted NBD/HSP70 family sugar kinase
MSDPTFRPLGPAAPAGDGPVERRIGERLTGLSLVRALNEQRVLETVLREGPVSRARIARLTGLSKPTVSSVVKDLVACGLVRERGRDAGSVGRPSTLYESVARAGFVFAADVGGTKVRAGIADPYGEVIAEATEPTVRDRGAAVVEQVARIFRSLMTRAGLPTGRVWAAGIGIAGIYDPEADRVSSAPNLPPDLPEIPLSGALVEAMGIPVVIENDVNLAAVGERWRGLAADRDHFVSISIGTGVGMGIVLNGELYRGSRGAAGEIDFLPLGEDPFDGQREHGPLESASTGPAILERLRRRVRGDAAPYVPSDDAVAAIFEAAERRDPLALDLVEEEARTVALAIVSVSAVLDPQLVVLGGGVGSNPGLLEPVRRYVAQAFPRPLQIEVSALGDAAAFYGAVAAGLRAAREELLAQMAGAR